MSRPDPATIIDGRALAGWQQTVYEAGFRGLQPPDPPAAFGYQQGIAPALPDGSYVVAPQALFGSTADDATWINNAIAQATDKTGGATGGLVRLMPLNYNLLSPLTPVTGSRLIGSMPWSASENDNYSAGSGASGGTILTIAPGFSGTAAIAMVNSVTGVQQYGVGLENFTIEGNEVSSGTIYGILAQGAWGASFMRGVCVHRTVSDCLHMITDPTTGKIPDDWQITGCKFSASQNGYGAYVAQCADSWFTDCESSENDLDNWYANWGVNTRFTSCKGENSFSGAGFHFTGQFAGDTTWLTGCSTHANSLSGFQFDNAGPAAGGLGSYVLTGCVAQDDDQSETAGLAGFYVTGCASRVILNGCWTSVQSGVGPYYGVSQVSSSYFTVGTGCFFQGTSAATHDDGSNTHALVNQSPVSF